MKAYNGDPTRQWMNFSPGPAKLYPGVTAAIQDSLDRGLLSTSHRSDEFSAMSRDTERALRQLFQLPDDYQVFYVASATEAMERMIQNTVRTHSLHVVNGAFSERFYRTAMQLKRRVTKVGLPWGDALDTATLPAPDPSVELVAVTRSETSAGVMVPKAQIVELRKRFPEAILVQDVVSSAPHAPVDWAYVDAAFFSVQKGFGCPSGLAVLFVGPRAMQKAKELDQEGLSIGSHHNFLELAQFAKLYQQPETPNTLGIYLVGRVAQMMLEKGIDTVRQESQERAERIYAYFEAHPNYRPFVRRPEWRSATMAVIEAPALLESLERQGVIVGAGYGAFKDTHIRIANFPAHTMDEVEELLALCEA